MKKKLVIIFVKNIKLGKVKTRLAKSIGNEAAFEVYKELVNCTENATHNLTIDKRIYFSDAVDETKWQNDCKTVQSGIDLGERMQNAFANGFNLGYEAIILIGSDLPDISNEIIESGFKALEKNEVVFGPAEDGGYYLIGMNKLHTFVFEDKPWSESHLLDVSLNELNKNNIGFFLLEILNDIDTYEDLIASNFYKNNTDLQQKISQLNDSFH